MTPPIHLFRILPSEIYEHPPELSVKQCDIPNGPINGWVVFAVRLNDDERSILGPFKPIVERWFNDPQPLIKIPRLGPFATPHNEHPYRFLDVNDRNRSPGYERTCWYQSGYTLRWVRDTTGDGNET